MSSESENDEEMGGIEQPEAGSPPMPAPVPLPPPIPVIQAYAPPPPLMPFSSIPPPIPPHMYAMPPLPGGRDIPMAQWYTPPASKKRLWWIGPTLLALVVVGLPTLVVVLIVRDNGKSSSTRIETRAQKRAAMASAFSGNSGPVNLDPEQQADIQAFFTRFSAAAQRDDAVVATDAFDVYRMMQVVQQAGSTSFTTSSIESPAVQSSVKSGMRNSFKGNLWPYAWTRFQIKQIQSLSDNAEALVYIRARGADNVQSSCRFWLRKTDSTWRIYDFESADVSVRLTSIMAASGGSPTELQDIRSLNLGIAAIRTNDVAGALKSLDAIGLRSLPGAMEGVRHVLRASCLVRLGRPREAIPEIEAAEKIIPDAPSVDLARARVSLETYNYPMALAALDRYEKVLGEEAVTLEIRGSLLEREGKPEEAVPVLLRGLDQEPQSVACFQTLCRAMPLKRHSELVARFEAFTNRLDLLGTIGIDAVNDRNLLELDHALMFYAVEDPQNKDAGHLYNAAERLVLAGDYAGAARAFEAMPAWARTSPYMKDVFLSEYTSSLRMAGRYEESYALEPIKRDAFLAIARLTDNRNEPDALQQIIHTHGGTDPADPVLTFYRGVLAQKRKKPAEAEGHFRAAMLLDLDKPMLNRARYTLVDILFDDGRWANAYATLGPKDTVYNLLRRQAISAARPDILRALIELRKADVPMDVDLQCDLAQALFLEKKYEQTIGLILQLWPRVTSDQEQQAYWRAPDLMVRSLVRAGRADDAVPYATGEKGTAENWKLAALSLGFAGDTQKAISYLDQMLADEDSIDDLNDDKDLGPLLKTAPFAAWQKKRLAATRPTSRAIAFDEPRP